MNLRNRITRMGRKHKVQNPCPLCARGEGAASLLLLRPGEQPDDQAAACPRCGATAHSQHIVVLTEPERSNLWREPVGVFP